jgi:hypothetical protein
MIVVSLLVDGIEFVAQCSVRGAVDVAAAVVEDGSPPLYHTPSVDSCRAVMMCGSSGRW